jgi:hypothetical protein
LRARWWEQKVRKWRPVEAAGTSVVDGWRLFGMGVGVDVAG